MHSIESPPVGQRFVWTISWICVVLSIGTISQEKEHRMCKYNIAALGRRILPQRLGQSAGRDCLILSIHAKKWMREAGRVISFRLTCFTYEA